jgi:hypothetical protein
VIKRKSTISSGSFEIKKPEESLEVKQPKRKTFEPDIRGLFYAAYIISMIIAMAIAAILSFRHIGPWAMPIVVILGLILMIVIIATGNFIMKKRQNRIDQRTKPLADWAKAKGFKFCSTKDFGLANRYCFKCLESGERSCYATDIIEGTFSGRRMCAFNYLHDLNDIYNNSENAQPIGDNILGKYILSAVVIETSVKFQRFQPLCIRPESLLDKATESVGLDDITFESIEFNGQFHVKAKDRRWAYDVVNQATMELLLASPRFIIEFQDRHVIAYRNKLFVAKDIEKALQLLTGILDRLPESVVQELQVNK